MLLPHRFLLTFLLLPWLYGGKRALAQRCAIAAYSRGKVSASPKGRIPSTPKVVFWHKGMDEDLCGELAPSMSRLQTEDFCASRSPVWVVI
jgi:hypothetical protein